MAINDNQSKKHRIYLKATRQWVEVSETVYREHTRFYDAFRKKAQYHGQCICPKNKFWLCDGDCFNCEFRRGGDMLSLDFTSENEDDDTCTPLDAIPDKSPLLDEIICDKATLEQLFSRLQELMPEAEEIGRLRLQDMSDEAIADILGIKRTTFRSRLAKAKDILAAEGTDAHSLCEYKLRKSLGQKAKNPTKQLFWYSEEMEDCATGYAAYILEQVEAAKQTCTDPVVLIEQRVDFSRWVEQGFGTADCIVIADGTLRICDYKHGLGILVSAEDNPQMKCYALGALELFDDIYDIDTVNMTIYQPRRQNVSTCEISKDKLYRWAEEVLKPTAALAFAGDGNYLCGEWCGFCKAKHECRARAEANLSLAQHDFKLPPLLEQSGNMSS